MNGMSPGTTRSRLLKAVTAEAHAALDSRVMQLRPFDTRARYALFLQVQYAFQRHVEPLYRDNRSPELLPLGTASSRLSKLEADLRDLGVKAEARAPELSTDFLPQALGWLYVAEGSKLGAAVLFRAACALGFSEGFGARHLAPHPAGQGHEWRRFAAALDAAPLSPEEDSLAAGGALSAFSFYADRLECAFAALADS